MDTVFPFKEDVDYTKLQMTPEGLYSITRRRDGERILAFLRSKIPHLSKRAITDATACVGGDTLLFSLYFRKVDSIEWKHDNCIVLRNNVDVFGATNVKIHEGDSSQIFNWKTDVLYIDPPWGGPAYKDSDHIDLCIGNQRIDMWLSNILEQPWRPFYVFLKLPSNYNFLRIDELPNVMSVHRFSIRKFVLLGLVISQNGTVEE